MRTLTCLFFVFSALAPLVYAQIREGALTQTEQAELKRATDDLKSADPDIVYHAACNLIRISHRRSLQVLKEHIEGGTPTAKLKIVKALGDKRDDGVLDAIDDYLPLLKTVLPSEDKELQTQLIRTLAALESPQVASFLAETAKAYPKDGKRTEVVVGAFSSMRLNNIKSIGYLIEAGKSISDTASKGRLLKTLNTTLFKEFRSFAEASEWFVKNRDKSFEEVMKEHWTKIREKLRETEKERDAWRRQCVDVYLRWIRSLPPPQRLEEVLRIITGKETRKVTTEVEVKRFAIRELGRLKAKEHYQKILPYLQSADDGLRLAAIEALGELGVKEAATSIAPMVRDASPDIRLSAIRTLVRLSCNTKEFLQQLKEENESNIISALLTAVDTLNIVEALPILLQKMFTENEGTLELNDDLSPELKKETIRAVGRLAVQVEDEKLRRKAVNALVASLDDEEASVRFYACEGLGLVGAPIAQTPLALRLKDDESPGVRAAAAKALGRIKRPSRETIQTLKDALTSKEKEVVVAVIAALRSQCGLTDENTSIDTKLLKEVSEDLMSKKMFEQVVALLSLPRERLKKMKKDEAAKVASILLLSAKAYENTGDMRKATTVYRDLIIYLQGKKEQDARSELAELLSKQERYAEALVEYDTLLKTSSERQTEFWHKKLDIIEKIMEKDKKAAVQHIRNCVESAKQNDFPQEIRERLKKIAEKAGIEFTPPK